MAERTADFLTLESMKFLAARLPDLKLRLLERMVQEAKENEISDTLSQKKVELHKMTVCKAVEDRICKQIDLASRTDLTARQAKDALRLLLKIARRNGLLVDFSPAELDLLRRSFQPPSREVTSWPVAKRRR